MATPLEPLSIKQYLVSMGGVQALFSKCTAPKVMKGETKYNDGQTGVMKTHLDFLEYEKVNLTKNFSASQDGTLLDFVKDKMETGEKVDVTIQPVKADKAGSAVPGAKTIVLMGCQVVSVTYPQVDREGSGLSTLVVELAPEDIITQ